MNTESQDFSATTGLVVLFGSGETSPSGRKVFDSVMRRLPAEPRVSLLETPAGFELNSSQVIGRVGDFLRHRLQNHRPQISIVPARKRGTPFSPDDPQVVAPLLQADLIFMGPGSPTYAVRQLRESLAWNTMIARHRLGACIALASAAVIATSAYALPVYEIYKAGQELHWKEGLDLFGLYGLSLVFIPHWNNQDGGAELDTSRCFMGQLRFAQLMDLLPPNLTVLGIDEKTALVIDAQAATCQVIGSGEVTLLHTGHLHSNREQTSGLEGSGLVEVAEKRNSHVHRYRSGQAFQLKELGPFRLYHPEAHLPVAVWQEALEAHKTSEKESDKKPPQEVQDLLRERQDARDRKDWAASDILRERIASLGWKVVDSPDGQRLSKN